MNKMKEDYGMECQGGEGAVLLAGVARRVTLRKVTFGPKNSIMRLIQP